jgi:hypothetical protein
MPSHRVARRANLRRRRYVGERQGGPDLTERWKAVADALQTSPDAKLCRRTPDIVCEQCQRRSLTRHHAGSDPHLPAEFPRPRANE